MGWVKPPRTYDLTRHLEGNKLLDGLSVQMRGMTVAELFEFNERLGDMRIVNGMFPPEQAEDAHWAYARLAAAIVSWNYVDDAGRPVETDPTGVRTLDHDQAWELLTAWLEVLSGVPAPLDRTSISGERSEVESLSMETLSESPES